MSDEETLKLDVEGGLLRDSCLRLLGEGGEVLIGGRIRIMRVSGEPHVDAGDGYRGLEDVGAETAGEIIQAANKQAKQEREEAEYLDPDKNPFIRTGPED